jgi:hypothetical protein
MCYLLDKVYCSQISQTNCGNYSSFSTFVGLNRCVWNSDVCDNISIDYNIRFVFFIAMISTLISLPLKIFLKFIFDEVIIIFPEFKNPKRYFEKIVEGIISLAFLIIRLNQLKSPESEEHAFLILAKNKIISEDFAKRLKDAKQLSNIYSDPTIKKAFAFVCFQNNDMAE